MLHHDVFLQGLTWSLRFDLARFRRELWNWLDRWNSERWFTGHYHIDPDHPEPKSKIYNKYLAVVSGLRYRNDQVPEQLTRDAFFEWCSRRPEKEKRRIRPWIPTAKYIRNVDHKKKHKEKDLWREEKDKYYRKDRLKSWSSGRKTWAKKHSSSRHRQWVRETITREKWDDFHDGEYKIFADPWLWD